MSYLQDAFNQVCTEAKQAEGYYVALMERTQFYGGPEEGGWYGHDIIVHAYQHFTTEEAANAAKEQVEKLSQQLTLDEKRSHGEHCLRQMDWLDDRGLDADFLPEDDGPSDFYVTVTSELPTNSYGGRHYE